MKAYLVKKNTAKPIDLQGHTITKVHHVRALPVNQLIDDLLALNYSITKHAAWGDELEGYDILLANQEKETH